MKATCVKDKNHNRFITVAHVSEDWVVDENGNWISTLASLETVSSPNKDNEWTCQVCGSKAVVEE